MPSSGDLPNSGIKLVSLVSRTLAGVLFVCLFLPLAPPGKSLTSEGHTQTSTQGWARGPPAVTTRGTLAWKTSGIKKQI